MNEFYSHYDFKHYNSVAPFLASPKEARKAYRWGPKVHEKVVVLTVVYPVTLLNINDMHLSACIHSSPPVTR